MTVKEYLRQAYLLDQRIKSYSIECDELRQMAQSISSPGFEEHYNASKNTDAPYIRTLELPRSTFTDSQLENLQKLVDAKAPLLKQALAVTELPIIITDELVSFPWFTDDIDAESCAAYTCLITAICKMAKEAKRVTAKEKEVENAKYAFRCFLLRLGFIGDEYKQNRKILMKNLSGSSAFKSGTKKGGEQ